MPLSGLNGCAAGHSSATFAAATELGRNGVIGDLVVTLDTELSRISRRPDDPDKTYGGVRIPLTREQRATTRPSEAEPQGWMRCSLTAYRTSSAVEKQESLRINR